VHEEIRRVVEDNGRLAVALDEVRSPNAHHALVLRECHR